MSDDEWEMEINDDVLSEILLRLPPEPCSLPRASLVSTRWRGLSRDPVFLRRFRARHRRHAPLLGVFFNATFFTAISSDCKYLVSFVPTLDPPNRVRFSFPLSVYPYMVISCRHGLLLISCRHGLLVWDPVTGDQHRPEFPPPPPEGFRWMNAAVLRASDDAHFQVVVVGHDQHHTQALAFVYSSQTREWGSVISAPIPPIVSIVTAIPSVLIGDSLYWLSSKNPAHPTTLLEFNLGTQSLAVIHVPVNMYGQCKRSFWVMRAEDGGLGFLFLSGNNAQLWRRRNTGGDGAAPWAIAKTIQLDKLLSLNTEEEKRSVSIEGFAEETNVVFLKTTIGHFMVQLESLWSLKWKELSKAEIIHVFHPFASVYTAASSLPVSVMNCYLYGADENGEDLFSVMLANDVFNSLSSLDTSSIAQWHVGLCQFFAKYGTSKLCQVVGKQIVEDWIQSENNHGDSVMCAYALKIEINELLCGFLN